MSTIVTDHTRMRLSPTTHSLEPKVKFPPLVPSRGTSEERVIGTMLTWLHKVLYLSPDFVRIISMCQGLKLDTPMDLVNPAFLHHCRAEEWHMRTHVI